jgi:hypothetical protein
MEIICIWMLAKCHHCSDTLQAFRSGRSGKSLVSTRKTEVENAGIFHREGGCELEGVGGPQWVGAEKAKCQFTHCGGRIHLVPCGGEFREAFACKLGIGGIQRSVTQTALEG